MTVMPVLRAFARPMVASIFIAQGFDTFRNPDRVAPAAEPVVAQLSERLSFVPAKTEQAVRLNGAVQMVAGSLLALGKFPRLSAAVLAATLVPTTAAGHRFWEAEDDADPQAAADPLPQELLDVRRSADRRGRHRREPVAGLAVPVRGQDSTPGSVDGGQDG